MFQNYGAKADKEKKVVGMIALRRGTAYYIESRNSKGAAYISTKKDVWHGHANMRMIKEMKTEKLLIVIKGKHKLNIECKCCIQAKICKNIYRNLETVKTFFWNNEAVALELIGSIKPKLKEGKRRLINMSNIHTQKPATKAIVNDRPLYPPRLIKTRILNNPFSDIILRIIVQKSEKVKDNSKTETAAVKDINVLSFGEDAEQDDESAILNIKFSAVEPPGPPNKKRKKDCNSDWESDDENYGAKVDKEKRVVGTIALKRGTAYYVESRNRKGAANLETTKAAEILGLWHMELIRSRKPTLKGGKRYVLPTDDYWRKEPFG
ncbi:Peptidyl-prolyl isomerase cwc27 [Eufriesea mexicana]|uniref:Peptidyl-prolyl isomerase cwc27 n=1 Tax=Eufriesea mexicana TaxID=516756 RepID=A0A310SFB0_9HYME|nr:Peptidyl-prolyl isomerase cwc27 [Eufriesea mexicana]